MANKDLKKAEEERRENIEAKVSAADKFFKENKKTIIACFTTVAVVALAVLAYINFIYKPQCAEAKQAAYPAELSFQNGQWEVALNGDGENLGFAEIISTYGTKSGKAVYMYAGVCELQLGNFQEAIDYLAKYKGGDPVLAARAIACQGDAYVGLEDYANALASYKNAAAVADNNFAAAYLLKAGLVCIKMGDKASALPIFLQIQDKYPQTFEYSEAAKYIAEISE